MLDNNYEIERNAFERASQRESLTSIAAMNKHLQTCFVQTFKEHSLLKENCDNMTCKTFHVKIQTMTSKKHIFGIT